MRKLTFFTIALAFSLPAYADIKSCDELKAEISAKIESNGVKDFTLEIVANDQVADRKVVGSCEGGTKKIVYTKNN